MLRFLKEEWKVVKGAPGLFVVAVLGFIIVFVIPAFKFFYDRQMETLEARIDGYKEELGRVEYPKESKALLQRQALELVGQIREFVEGVVRDEETSGLGHRIVTGVTSVIALSGGLPHEKALYYERHFKIRAIRLRDRMLRQLPPNEDRVVPQYDKLTIPAIRAVADDLEGLARELGSTP